MKLVECFYSNMPMLYETIRQCLINNYNESPDRLKDILEHVQISFEIEHISILDRYLLSMYCRDMITDISNRINYTDIQNNLFEKNQKFVYQLSDTAIAEKNRFNINDTESGLPLLTQEYSSIISFRGSSILKLTGFMLQKFFVENLKIDLENPNIPEYLPDNIDGDSRYLEKALYNKFLENFQDFKSKILNGDIQDLLCSMILYTNYYSYDKKPTKTSGCNIGLFGVNTPFGYIDFTSDTNSVNLIASFIHDKLKGLDQEVTKSKVKIIYGVESSLYTFLKFNILTNSKFTLDHESFNTLLSNYIKNVLPKNVNISPDPKDMIYDMLYMIENSEFFDKMNLDSTPEFATERYELLPFNTPIKYNIEISLQDINQVIHPMLKKNISEKGMFIMIEQIALSIYSLLYNN